MCDPLTWKKFPVKVKRIKATFEDAKVYLRGVLNHSSNYETETELGKGCRIKRRKKIESESDETVPKKRVVRTSSKPIPAPPSIPLPKIARPGKTDTISKSAMKRHSVNVVEHSNVTFSSKNKLLSHLKVSRSKVVSKSASNSSSSARLATKLSAQYKPATVVNDQPSDSLNLNLSTGSNIAGSPSTNSTSTEKLAVNLGSSEKSATATIMTDQALDKLRSKSPNLQLTPGPPPTNLSFADRLASNLSLKSNPNPATVVQDPLLGSPIGFQTSGSPPTNPSSAARLASKVFVKSNPNSGTEVNARWPGLSTGSQKLKKTGSALNTSSTSSSERLAARVAQSNQQKSINDGDSEESNDEFLGNSNDLLSTGADNVSNCSEELSSNNSSISFEISETVQDRDSGNDSPMPPDTSNANGEEVVSTKTNIGPNRNESSPITFSSPTDGRHSQESGSSNVGWIERDILEMKTDISFIKGDIQAANINIARLLRHLMPQEKKLKLPPNMPTPSLHISSLEDFDKMEEFLQHKVNLDGIIEYLGLIPVGTKEGSAAMKLMSKVMSNGVASSFNFDGKSWKLAFKETNLWKAVEGGLALHFKGSTLEEALTGIRNWLKNAPQREGGKPASFFLKKHD